MEDRLSRTDRLQPFRRVDLVQPPMKIGEEPRVPKDRPRPPRDVDAHRGSGGALEDEVGAFNAHDLGCGISVLAHITHHRKLVHGDIAPAITTQDGTRIERVHVRVATACERL